MGLKEEDVELRGAEGGRHGVEGTEGVRHGVEGAEGGRH